MKSSSCDHQFPWSGCLTDCNRATIAVDTPEEIISARFTSPGFASGFYRAIIFRNAKSGGLIRTIKLFEDENGKDGFSLVRINNKFAEEITNMPFLQCSGLWLRWHHR